jgi:3-hydroxyisobutyrate dehydrogenase-like beta-hydroxyacid dehydrogenase
MIGKKESKSMKKVGVIGLGNIGSKVAENLLSAQFEVYGYSPNRKDDFINNGGKWTESVGDLASRVEVIIHCLPSTQILERTVDQILASEETDLAVIDISSYELADKMAQAERLAAKGIVMLDCELSGLPFMVTKKTAVIFQSGNKFVIDSMADIFEAITEKHFYLGEFGTATKMKQLANVMVCVHNLIGAEILNLAEKSGMDKGTVFEVLSQSAASSNTFVNKGPLMISREFDTGPGPFSHMFKYLTRILGLAEDVGAETPLIACTQKIYNIAEREGRHDQDIAAILSVVEQLSQSAPLNK